MNFVRVNNAVLHYEIGGQSIGPQSDAPLVFINSLGTDLRIWDDVVSALQPDYPIVRYDKRGHGLSECPPAPYAMRDHTLDLAGLLDYLEIPSAILIGISVGGMIAIDFAATYPDRVTKLVLCDTALKIGTPEMWNERIATLREKGMSSLAEPILARWFAPSYPMREPVAHVGYYRMLTSTPVAGYTGTCEAIRDADLRGNVPKIQVPTLVLCGAKDLATPPAQAEELAATLPNAHFTLIEDAGHLPCIEQPKAVSGAILKWLIAGDCKD